MTGKRLVMGRHLREQILAAAREAAPEEACGLLLGREGEGEGGTWIEEAIPSPNRSPRSDGFELDPQVCLESELRGRSLGLRVVGVWHSHPGGAAKPSFRDRQLAWPGWIYVILGEELRGEDLRAFLRGSEDFRELELVEEWP